MNIPQGDAETPRDLLAQRIIAAAIEVHRSPGPGLLESAYEACLCHELHLASLKFERQVVPEVKAVEVLLPVHSAQLLTYLKLAALPTGLIRLCGAGTEGRHRETVMDPVTRRLCVSL